MFKMTQTGEKMRSYLFIESRGLQTFFGKVLLINFFGFACSSVFSVPTQVCFYSKKEAMHNTQMNE